MCNYKAVHQMLTVKHAMYSVWSLHMNDNDKQLEDVSCVNTITTKIMQINTLCKLLFTQWDVCVTSVTCNLSDFHIHKN